MNLADSYEEARIYLGWTFEFLAKRMGGRYSKEYLRRVHGGIPMPEVEQNLTDAYLRALAEKAVSAVTAGRSAKALKPKFVESFVRLVEKHRLSLSEVVSLSKRATTVKIFAPSFHGVVAVDDLKVWDETLESIIQELANKPDETMQFDMVELLVETKPAPKIVSQSQFRYECSNCYTTYVEPMGCRCPNCGNQSLFNPNCD